MVYKRVYPDKYTYSGPAHRITLVFGSAALPPSEETIANTTAQTIIDQGYKPLIIQVNTRGSFPYWEFDAIAEVYEPAGIGLAIPVLVYYIILALIALAALGIIWLISQNVEDIIVSPAGPIIALALLVGIVVIGYYVITTMKKTKAESITYSR